MKRIAALALCGVFFAALPAQAVQSGTQWPMMLADPGHSSHSTDGAITAVNGSTFGVRWMANLYSSDLGSPVVAFNSALNKTIAYVGDQRADLYAVDASNGNVLWSVNLGLNDKIEDTPAVAADGSVWVGTAYNSRMYKLNGATGNVECSVVSPVPIDGSPMIVKPTGGVETVYWDAIDTNAYQGALTATNESDCSQQWQFTGYTQHSGSWTTPAWGVGPEGNQLVIIGTSDPDSTEYGINALTGALAWSYKVANPGGAADIGAAATVSAPGKNGFGDGAAYVTTKFGNLYALNMSRGVLLWKFVIAPNTNASSSRSSVALDGTQAVFGYGHDSGLGGSGGIYSINAATAAVNWDIPYPVEVLSSPAIVGPTGAEVVTFGDLMGLFHVLRLRDGASLYTYQTGSYITSSPAEANGTVFIAGADGFLYAFGANGGNPPAPSTAITSPANNSVIANPNGSITVSGTASDAHAVSGVEVAIEENGASGPWYNTATASFSNAAPIRNAATLASPNAATTAWSYTFPAPAAGGSFQVLADTMNASHVVNTATTVSFAVQPSSSEPNVQLSNAYVAPGQTTYARSTAFKPGEQVAFSLFGNVVATATATSTGFVPKTAVTVPVSAPAFGPTSLTLTGQTSGKTTSAVLYVVNNWNQSGHDAMHTGLEPNDPVIAASLSIGNNTVLNQSWYYSSGAAINSSPTVYDRVAYFGNDAGTMTAVAVNTGAPIWTYTTASGKAIQTAPAIDAGGNVLFTSTDSSLYVVSPTGSLLQNAALAGKLTSPVSNAGNIFVASDAGTLYKLSDPSAAVAWSVSLPAASHGAPAYDSANNTVVTVDDNGDVGAYAADTGTRLWQYTTGGAVTASPMIYNGNVYAGSADGYGYSINEKTGALNWKGQMTAPVSVSPALYTPTEVSFIDSKGIMNLFNVSGHLDSHWTSNVPNAVGMANVKDDMLITYAKGLVGIIRLDGPAPFAWKYLSPKPFTTTTAIVDGTVYLGAQDGGLYAFTPQGAVPQSRVRATISAGDGSSWACTTP